MVGDGWDGVALNETVLSREQRRSPKPWRPDRRDRANHFYQFQVARHFAPSIGCRRRQRIRSRDAAFYLVLALRRRRCLAHIEFENAPNNDKFPRSVAVLRAHEAERLIAVDEKPAADTARILNDPVAAAIAPNSKPTRLAWRLRIWRLRARRRFCFFSLWHQSPQQLKSQFFFTRSCYFHSGDRSSSIFEASR